MSKGIYKNFSRNSQAIRFDFISIIQIILEKSLIGKAEIIYQKIKYI